MKLLVTSFDSYCFNPPVECIVRREVAVGAGTGLLVNFSGRVCPMDLLPDRDEREFVLVRRHASGRFVINELPLAVHVMGIGSVRQTDIESELGRLSRQHWADIIAVLFD